MIYTFPEKLIIERKKNIKKFYRNLFYYLVENIKGLTLSKEELNKRMVFTNDFKPLLYFLSDQSFKKENTKYSSQFLHQETPAYRGYYQTTFREVKPRNRVRFKKNELVHAFYEHLTQTTQRNPDNLLWSHKRWKHKKELDF